MKKTFKHDGQTYTGTLNASGDPITAIITDVNGDEVATLDYPQETREDMAHYKVADDEDMLDTLIETFRNQDMPAFEGDDEEE